MTSRYSKLYKPKGAPPSQRSNVITTIKQDMSLQIVWHSILGGGSKLKVSLSLEVVKVAPGGLLSLSLPPRLASTHWRCLSLGEVMRLRAVKLYWWSYWMLWLQRYSCRDSAVKKNLWPHTLLILIGSCNEHRQTSHTLSHWSNYKFAR